MRRLVSSGLGVLLGACGQAASDQTPPTEPLAFQVSGLSIAQIAMYQGVKVPLTLGGDEVPPRPAPLVQGRDALVRVFVAPAADWQPREVIVRLDSASGSLAYPARELRRFVSQASSEEDLDSGFNFAIPGAEITADYNYRVSILEVGPQLGPPTWEASFPPQGNMAWLGAEYAGASLKMVLVPVQYQADGSGRLPDTSEPQVERMRTSMLDQYPVPRVDVRVRAQPLVWTEQVAAFGNGWSSLLQNLLYVRQLDIQAGQATSDEYYYGMVSPSGHIAQYCGQGCVLGLTFQTDEAPSGEESYLRGSVGVGFGGDLTAGTFVHEIGHAHGRLHSPCAPGNQIQSVDPAYPHANAGIGSFGYRLSTGELISPTGSARDFMSYCDPTWVSDYTFAGLFDKIATVNGAYDFRSAMAPSPYRAITIGEDGELSLGVTLVIAGTPSGRPESVTVEGGLGQERQTTGYFHAHDHLPGGMLLVSQSELRGRKVRVRGRSLAL